MISDNELVYGIFRP